MVNSFLDMITVQLIGGLGNQMFQYAMGRALALRLHAPLCLNTSSFVNTQGSVAHIAWRLPLFPNIIGTVRHVDDRQPSYFHNCLRRINFFAQRKLHWNKPLFPNIVIEPHFEYWPGVEEILAPVHLYGYWQSEKYFTHYTDQIRRDFTFPSLPEGAAKNYATRIMACPDAISVHIRRGDYVSNPQALAFHGLLGPVYYRSALERIRDEVGSTIVFLFSDDPQWGRDNFDPCGHVLEVVDLKLSESPQHDMHLMTLCRHHVIANSSFSWWGAWLGSPDGITIAPKRWFADVGTNGDDIYPQGWIRL